MEDKRRWSVRAGGGGGRLSQQRIALERSKGRRGMDATGNMVVAIHSEMFAIKTEVLCISPSYAIRRTESHGWLPEAQARLADLGIQDIWNYALTSIY